MDYYREYLELSAALLLLEWDGKITDHRNTFWSKSSGCMEVCQAHIQGCKLPSGSVKTFDYTWKPAESLEHAVRTVRCRI